MINKRKNAKWLLLAAILCMLVFVACENKKPEATNAPSPTQAEAATYVDYAASIKFDMNSSTVKQKVTVKSYVDGDTTHFNVPESVVEGGVLKARYLAIDTPESTGKIEEWGKKASKFTREKLSGASSIIIESDTERWNVDSTGGRYLVWVWYRSNENEEYRNLNIELLQEGLAIASSAANNRYGSTAMAAISNAKALKLNIYSGEKDPDFFYGEAVELTLKELKTNVQAYQGMKVAFNGVITKNNNNGVYVESYDEETGIYFGIYVYYGFGLTGDGLSVLSVGNLARIVGSVQYYEAGGTYQISGLTYRQMKPDDPNNIKKLGDGYQASFVETDADKLLNGSVTLEVDGEEKTFAYGELVLDTTVTLKNLQVTEIYTTSNTESSSYGAMTITANVDGQTITIRTDVLYDDNKNLITDTAYLNKNITVKGLVGKYDGKYQVKVISANDIIINE